MRIATLALVLPAVPLAITIPTTGAIEAAPTLGTAEATSASGTLGAPLQEEQAPAAEPQLSGTFVPEEFREIELWPAEYSGELLVLEVLPHGAYVNEGDVVARLDTETIDEQVVEAQRALAAAERGHHATSVRAEMAAQAAKEDRQDRERELERARREHVAYLEKEVAFRRRQSELASAMTTDRIEDMALELQTLESMYADDELIDATEEIVIQRSRRDLARARASQALSEERRALQLELELEHEVQRRTEALQKKEREHERFLRGQELEAIDRAAGLEDGQRSVAKARERIEGLKHDRGLFELHAPASGVLLHGGAKAQAGGRPEHARGGRAATRTPLFTIARPDHLAVALELDTAARERLGEASAVAISGPWSNRRVMGHLTVERYPTAASVGRGEPVFAARVELVEPLRGVVVGLTAGVHPPGAAAENADPHADTGNERTGSEHRGQGQR